MNCDKLARWYRWLEYAGFGRSLERRRLEFLPRLGGAGKVLMLGEGDGRFLAAFVRQYPSATVDYVDASREMLALARQRVLAAAARPLVRFHHADVFVWLDTNASQTFDLISTHFFLDCFTQPQLETLVRAIQRQCLPGAKWIVSEFRIPPRGLSSIWARAVVAALYGFFGLAAGLKASRLPSHAAALPAAGFQRQDLVLACGGLLLSERWELG